MPDLIVSLRGRSKKSLCSDSAEIGRVRAHPVRMVFAIRFMVLTPPSQRMNEPPPRPEQGACRGCGWCQIKEFDERGHGKSGVDAQ